MDDFYSDTHYYIVIEVIPGDVLSRVFIEWWADTYEDAYNYALFRARELSLKSHSPAARVKQVTLYKDL